MEYLLHISYNISFKQWIARTPKQKVDKENKKKTIQKTFKNTNSLIIDHVLQGKGTSNDGNTARRFFKEHKASAEILGIDSRIIEMFYVVLQVVSSGLSVDISKFRQYCETLAKKCIQSYPWYYMPVTVHKLLFHGE